MIAEIEAGHIATVIVKDMSRFGRNYLEVGFYTEIQFPSRVFDSSLSTIMLTVPIPRTMTLLRS